MPPSPSRRLLAAADQTPAAARPRATDRAGEAEPVAATPFWRQKTLDALTPAEWESLCDGCGRCCLVKLEDEDSGEIYFTDIACKLFDAQSCRCTDYPRRRRKVRDCIRLTPETVRSLSWLPPSCAYRLISEGRDLAWWHPLVSGSSSSVHEAGVSARGRVAASETQVELDDYPAYIVSWPGKAPRPAEPKSAPGNDSAKNEPKK